MLKQPIMLEQKTNEEYIALAEKTDFRTRRFDTDRPTALFAEIVSAPVYETFEDLLQDLGKAIQNNWIRLIHIPGKSYSESEKEYMQEKANPDYYKRLAQSAEQAKTMNVELFLISESSQGKRTYRGNKLMFRKKENVYLAKIYAHKNDFESMGVELSTDKEFHAVQAVSDR